MERIKKRGKQVKVDFYPGGKRVMVSMGTGLKEAIQKAGLDVNFPCGERGMCGKCRVKIEGKTSPRTLSEEKYFPLEEETRLACQTKVMGNVRVNIPSPSLTSFPRFLIRSALNQIEIKRDIKKIFLNLNPPDLKDPIDDLTRIKRELGKMGISGLGVDLELIKGLGQVIRQDSFKVTVVLNGKKMIGVEKGDTRGKNFGVAFDIGTTTVVGVLLDLDTGQEMATHAILNPQVSFGEDVVTRIRLIQSRRNDGLKMLQREIVRAVNEIITELVKKGKIKRKNIYKATFVGNTTMQHLFLGVNPINLALYPYVPVVTDAVKANASFLRVNINPHGELYIFPNIAAFIGGDTVGVILATSIFQKRDKKIRLAVDIGTNGEMVLSKKGRLVCASTAAGPAFEGARIFQGMRAGKGAIEKVELRQGKVKIGVIGGGKAKGICGSGLVDVSSELLKEGVIDSSGYIRPARKEGDVWKERIVKKDGKNCFVLSKEDESEAGIPVIVTQQDIRELQLAKGAINAGLNILLEKMEIMRDEVDQVLLAGAFGSFINPKSACLIGLMPSFPKAEIRSVGNAASLGAVMALLSSDAVKKAEKIGTITEYIELAASPRFQDKLVEGMKFKEN